MAEIVSGLKSGDLKYVDVERDVRSNIFPIINFYIEKKWCKKKKKIIDQLEELMVATSIVDDNREELIERIINKDPKLKKFLMVNTVFGVNDNVRRDWLARTMIKILDPTEEEVMSMHNRRNVPKELDEKFKNFKLRIPTEFEKNLDDVYVRFLYFGFKKKGESTDPVHITDRIWENIKVRVPRKQIAEMLKKYKPIVLG